MGEDDGDRGLLPVGELVDLDVQQGAVVGLHDDRRRVQGAEALVVDRPALPVDVGPQRLADGHVLRHEPERGADTGGRETDAERQQADPRTPSTAHDSRPPFRSALAAAPMWIRGTRAPILVTIS